MDTIEKLAHAYFFAKKYVIKNGYSNEIDWQEEIVFEDITESNFLKEAAWVILSSGMSYKVIANKFPDISDSFYNWQDINIIINNKKKCQKKALKIFNNPQKINAILYFADFLFKEDFNNLKKVLKKTGANYLLRFPYMGHATSLHLAKNIGLYTSKPDRHLQRISKTCGFDSTNELCKTISDRICENISVVDLVIWRICNY